jgi:hypothetical protein
MEYHRNSGLTKQEWTLDKLADKIKRTKCSLTCIKILEQAINYTRRCTEVYVVTERDNYGEQLFRQVFSNKEQALEYLAENGLKESNIDEINEIELK